MQIPSAAKLELVPGVGLPHMGANKPVSPLHTHTCSKDDISTSTGGIPTGGRRKCHTHWDKSSSAAKPAPKAPAFLQGLFLSVIFSLFPRSHGQVGSTILWKRGDTIFPLSLKQHSHHSVVGAILWVGSDAIFPLSPHTQMRVAGAALEGGSTLTILVTLCSLEGCEIQQFCI